MLPVRTLYLFMTSPAAVLKPLPRSMFERRFDISAIHEGDQLIIGYENGFDTDRSGMMWCLTWSLQ
jgi:hypothetical protein